jgi:GTP-binding protein HflX
LIPFEKESLDSKSRRALVVHPDMASLSQTALDNRLEEAVGLAAAIGLVATASHYFSVRKPKPATLFGSGQVDQIRKMMEEQEASILIVDGSLTAIQRPYSRNIWRPCRYRGRPLAGGTGAS